MKDNYVYMLRCANGALYTGWTTDVQARLKAHNEGHGAKYTKAFGPCKLVYYEKLADKSTALKRETEIKKMSKKQKEDLVQSFVEDTNE